MRGGLFGAGGRCLCRRASNKFSSSLAHAIVVNGKHAAQNRIRFGNNVEADLASNATVDQGSSDQACWVVWVWTKLSKLVRARCWRHRWRAGGATRQVRISSCGLRDMDLDDASCSKAGGHSQQGAVGKWSSQTSEVRSTSRQAGSAKTESGSHHGNPLL